MPLRAKIDETKLPEMSSLEINGNDAAPRTGIKVIIIGAGKLLGQTRSNAAF